MKRLLESLLKPAVWIARAAVTVVAVWVVLLFFGGTRQQIDPSVVEQRLVQGMSVSDVEYALALPPGTLRPSADGVARLTSSGLMASFVPQHNIYLLFSAESGLTGAFVEVVYQLDELSKDIPLKGGSPE